MVKIHEFGSIPIQQLAQDTYFIIAKCDGTHWYSYFQTG